MDQRNYNLSFDKTFGEGVVKSTDELKVKIKEDAERNFKTQSDQKLMNDVTKYLVDNAKFDLPAAFLKKWLKTTIEKEITAEEAEEEYSKSEKGLRYQLIEGKLMKDHNVRIVMSELEMLHLGQVILQAYQLL